MAFQRRFTLNPKRFNINRHSNSIQKSLNLLHFGNIWKILKIRQNRSYNYHIITYLHRQNWQTMFFSYFYKKEMEGVLDALQVDVDQESILAEFYKIDGTPTFILF